MLKQGSVAEIVTERNMLTASWHTCLMQVKGKDKDVLLQELFNLHSI